MSLAKEATKFGLLVSHSRHSVLDTESTAKQQASLIGWIPAFAGMTESVQHDRIWGEIQFRPLVEKVRNSKIVGFDALGEVKTAVKNFNILIGEGKSKENAAEKSFEEIAENLRSWNEEFNEGKSVFSANYSFGIYEGKTRILDKSGLPVGNKIKEEERQGKAKSSWIEAEDFLKESPDNSVVLIISPKKESGLIIDGKLLDYVDSYIQIAAKINGKIEFFTIRTFAEVESCRVLHSNLMENFNTETVKLEVGQTRYDEVSNIVGTPLKLSSLDNPQLNQGLETFVFNLLIKINGLEASVFGDEKTLDSVYNEFLERQKGLKLDLKKQPLIDELKEFYLSILNQLHIPEIQELLAEKIEDILRKFTLLERGLISNHQVVLTYEQKEKAHGFMQVMHGCAGVGSKKDGNLLISVLGGLREVVENEQWHLGECGKCGAGKKDPKVEVSCGLCRNCVNSLKEMEKLGLVA